MRFLSEILNQDIQIWNALKSSIRYLPVGVTGLWLISLWNPRSFWKSSSAAACASFLSMFRSLPRPRGQVREEEAGVDVLFLTLVNYYVFRNIHIHTYIYVHILQGRDMKMKSRSLLIILDGPPSLLLLLFSLFFLYNIDFADDSENYNFKYRPCFLKSSCFSKTYIYIQGCIFLFILW